MTTGQCMIYILPGESGIFNQESCMISVHWTNHDQPVKAWCYCSDSTIQVAVNEKVLHYLLE